jgi:hypothetical protein
VGLGGERFGDSVRAAVVTEVTTQDRDDDADQPPVLIVREALASRTMTAVPGWTSAAEDGSSHDEWTFSIAPGFAPCDQRNVLPADPEGHIIRLIVGSDDGRVRRYDAYVNWRPDKRLAEGEWNSLEVLDSVVLELTKVP